MHIVRAIQSALCTALRETSIIIAPITAMGATTQNAISSPMLGPTLVAATSSAAVVVTRPPRQRLPPPGPARARPG